MTNGFDEEITQLLQETFTQALLIGSTTYTADQIRLMIIATNMQSLANTFLLADNNPEAVNLNLKQVALGLLGTKDWIMENLPEGVI